MSLIAARLILMRERGSGLGEPVLEIEAWLEGDSRDLCRHLHPLQEERVRVLEGQLVAKIGVWARTYRAGETFIIPPGADHALSAAGTEPTHIVTEVSPPLRTAELVEHLRRPAMAKLVVRGGWSKTLGAAIIAHDFPQEVRLVRPSLHLRPRVVRTLVAVTPVLGYRARRTRAGTPISDSGRPSPSTPLTGEKPVTTLKREAGEGPAGRTAE